MNIENTLVIVVLSYLIGSIPTAYLITRWRGVDIFSVGSGNMGATNVVRALGLYWGLGVMVLDILKGAAAIYLTRQFIEEQQYTAMIVSAISVIAGHNWSFFIKLLTGSIGGGKGAATAFGTMIVIMPIQIIITAFIIGAIIVVLTRLVSLAVLIGLFLALAWAVVLIWQGKLDSILLFYTGAIAALILVKFKGNIQRLLTGTERRLGGGA